MIALVILILRVIIILKKFANVYQRKFTNQLRLITMLSVAIILSCHVILGSVVSPLATEPIILGVVLRFDFTKLNILIYL